ncbi:MAG: alpha-ketoglutarate-dependent dioxygenase AlkB [Planctomycetaceae bacterium]|nr:alpha-ketoglutarate-dependent dioxygenase AlkB [Planctomycetaceae bacterium]
MPIPGLKYVADYVLGPAETLLLAAVEAEPWLTALKRRVQHYGFRYDYTARKVDPTMYLGPLPVWAQPLAARLVADGHMLAAPDQLIVNEYEPGQGINAHVDCVPCFGPVVCSITLGSQCVMEMSSVEADEVEPLLLGRGSLLVLAEDARYKWRHGIRGRKADTFGGQVFPRSRRVSLTFRTVVIDNEHQPA